jgi:cytochrome c553
MRLNFVPLAPSLRLKMPAIVALATLLATANPAAAADIAAGQKKAEACFACHGPNGNSRIGQYPVLAGQSARYIGLQLKDFKEGRRKNPDMTPMAAQLSNEDMQDLAVYFAMQKPAAIDFKPDPDKVQLGAKKSDETLCAMCHLGGLKGQNEIPRLAGQQPDYVMIQLKAFKARTRTNDGGNMTSVAQTLSEEDMLNLANYIGSLR